MIGAYCARGNGKSNRVGCWLDARTEATWGVRDKNLYLLGLRRQRLEDPALKQAVRDSTARSMRPRGDRGQGFRHPADPGAGYRWLSRHYTLPAGMRQGHGTESQVRTRLRAGGARFEPSVPPR